MGGIFKEYWGCVCVRGDWHHTLAFNVQLYSCFTPHVLETVAILQTLFPNRMH